MLEKILRIAKLTYVLERFTFCKFGKILARACESERETDDPGEGREISNDKMLFIWRFSVILSISKGDIGLSNLFISFTIMSLYRRNLMTVPLFDTCPSKFSNN